MNKIEEIKQETINQEENTGRRGEKQHWGLGAWFWAMLNGYGEKVNGPLIHANQLAFG